VKRSKYFEFSEFSSINLRLRVKITNHRDNSTVFKSCRKHYLKHCLTCFMHSIDAFNKVFDRKFDKVFDKKINKVSK